MNKELYTKLYSESSFVQILSYASGRNSGPVGDGVITGYGPVDGKLIFSAFEDSSVLSGAMGLTHAEKIASAIGYACKRKAPFVFYIDNKGSRINEGLDILKGYGIILKSLSEAVGLIPLIAVVSGEISGASSVIASMCDFTVMTKDSFMGLASRSRLDNLKLSESIIKKFRFSSAEMNAVSNGQCTYVAENDVDAFDYVKKLLSYLPESSESGPDIYDGCSDDPNRDTVSARSYISGNADSYDLLSDICDNNDYIEIWKLFAPNVITAFSRFNGIPAGIIFNRIEADNGLLDCAAMKKMQLFIDFCDRFSIPVISIVNTDGIAFSQEDELYGASSEAARLASTYLLSENPKLTIIAGYSTGLASILAGSKALGADYVYSWNNAVISVEKPSAVTLLKYSDKLTDTENPAESRQKMIKDYILNEADPYTAAQYGYVDDVIDPIETRSRIVDFLQIL